LFACYDLVSCLWRTFQGSLFAEWETFSETWPRSGMTRSGRAYRRPPLVPRTYATECSSWAIGRPRLLDGPEVTGYWPTPRAVENGQILTNRSDPRNAKTAPTLSEAVRLWPTPQAHDTHLGRAERVGRHGTKHGGRDLTDWVAMYPTPRAIYGEHPGMTDPRHLTGAVQSNGTTGQLNPAWVEWLMGYPDGWTDCAG